MSIETTPRFSQALGENARFEAQAPPRRRVAPLGLVLAGLAALTAGACGGGASDTPAGESPAPAPAAAAPAVPLGSARVAGTVSFTGEVPKLRPLVLGADPQCEAKHEGPVANPSVQVGEGGALANVLVYVRWTQAPFAPPSEPVVVDQRGCFYAPRVVGVQTGQTVRILNSDELLHNVHATSTANPAFNRAMPGAITQTEVVFQRPEEPFLVKCDVHPWMAAYVGVFEHPFFAVSGADGSFEISGLPAGTYELVAFHERFGTRTGSVTVEDGGSASVDFTFEATAPAGG